MDLTLGQHVSRLENRLEALNAELMNDSDLDRRNQIEAEIRATNLALAHYKAALEIETSILSGDSILPDTEKLRPVSRKAS